MAFTGAENTSKAALWAGRAIAALVTFAFLGSAFTKLAHVPKAIEGLTHAGIPEAAILPIGILELCCLTLYLIPRTAILGTFLLSGYMGGAILTHIVSHESLAPPLIVGLLMFTSAYLRHPEMRDIVPLRSMLTAPGGR